MDIGGIHLAGGGTNPQGGKRLLWYWPEKDVWKVVTVIIIFCLTTSIDFHDVLHGFWAGPGTGITSLEAKLLHKLINIS